MQTSGPATSPDQPDGDKQHDLFKSGKSLKNIGGKAVSGGMITAVAQGLRFTLYMGSTILLARLLSKEDFGLVAMVGSIIAFLRMFREAGLSTATMQKEGITHAQVSNLFWINVGLGVSAAVLGVLVSPAVAWFFHDDRLISITIWLTLTFVFSGSSVQHIALLNRGLRFKAMAILDIVSTTVGAAVGVAMAMTGWGYWSLVGSQVSTSITEMLMAWSLSRWRPQLPQRGAETRSLINFGASLTFATLLRRLTAGIDTLLIGRYWGAEALGIYSRGFALLMRPLDQLVVPFDIVFVPILSRLQSDPDRYRTTYRQAFSTIALLSFPAAGLLIGMSAPLVLLMLGPNWESVIPIFAALSLTALYYPILCTTAWLPTTQGRNRDIVRLGVLISIMPVAGCLIGLRFGINGVAWASSLLGMFVRVPMQFHVASRAGSVTLRDLWGMFFTYLPLWFAAGLASYFTSQLLSDRSPLVQVIAGTIAGLGASVVIVFLVPAQRAITLKLIEQVKEHLSRMQSKRASV